jgi:small-conductance mechanosensitive channel
MGIFFVALIWLTVLVMREVTWPSRSYLLAIIAELATAWLFVILTTRLIRSAPLRAVVRYGAWIYVTLTILNLRDEAMQILDTIGFSFGEMRLSLLLVLQAAVLLSALVLAARFLTRVTAARVQQSDDISPSMQVLIVKLSQAALYGAAIVIGLRASGIDLTGLAVLSGAIGVGIGFGLQKVVSNLISGIILLLDKSIKPGDVIEVGDSYGRIHSLGARYVSVVTRDGFEYLIPNEDLITQQVINWSFSNKLVRLKIGVGVSYDTDIHHARELVVEAAKNIPRVLAHPKPVCQLKEFGNSSVDLELRIWIADPEKGVSNVSSDVRLAIWDAFQENNIEIPFPQRDVHIKSAPPGSPLAEG